MNSQQIEQYLRGTSGFLGVFASDEFRTHARHSKIQGLFIVNTDPSTYPGRHWFVVDALRRPVVVFDSYGVLSPSSSLPDISLALHHLSPRGWRRTTPVLQSLDTNVCGDYCIVYCALRSWSRWSIERTLRSLSLDADTHLRDHAIRDLTARLFGVRGELLGIGDGGVHIPGLMTSRAGLPPPPAPP